MAPCFLIDSFTKTNVRSDHVRLILAGKEDLVETVKLGEGETVYYSRQYANSLGGRLKIVSQLIGKSRIAISHTTAAWIWCPTACRPDPLHVTCWGRVPRGKDELIWHERPISKSTEREQFFRRLNSVWVTDPAYVVRQCQQLSPRLRKLSKWNPDSFFADGFDSVLRRGKPPLMWRRTRPAELGSIENHNAYIRQRGPSKSRYLEPLIEPS